MVRVKSGGRADFLIRSCMGIRVVYSLVTGSRPHVRYATWAAVARPSAIMLDLAVHTVLDFSDFA